jgi:hypothetical protein
VNDVIIEWLTPKRVFSMLANESCNISPVKLLWIYGYLELQAALWDFNNRVVKAKDIYGGRYYV